MIALIPAFFRRTILLLSLLSTFTAQAGIKSVELIYDKTAVFKGNDVLFALKVTKNNGKVWKSTDEYTRFPCVDFEYSVSGRVKITGPSNKYFSRLIPEDFEADSISLDLKLIYPSSYTHFKLKVPLYKAVDHIESLHLFVDRDRVYNQRPLFYKIFADMEGDEGLEIKNRLITYDDIQITVLSGGFYNPMTSKIIPQQADVCDSLLVVRVALKNRPEIYTDEVFNIKKTAQNGSFSAISGRSGRNGTDPHSGRDGAHGTDGNNAGEITFYIKLGVHACTNDTMLVIENSTDQRSLYFARNNRKIVLEANGGNGGNGGNGHDGAYGSNGWTGEGLGGQGGDGGDGGDGGNGGNGGNGAFVKIVFTPETEKYVSSMIVRVNGGLAGKAGRYGRYGKKGLAGIGTWGNGVPGRDGYNGRDGQAGTAGDEGNVEFICYSDYLVSTIK
jgi:hypothetical protein